MHATILMAAILLAQTEGLHRGFDWDHFRGISNVNETSQCGAVCDYYQDMCLPHWVDPQNLFHPHCSDETDVKEASNRCVLCLMLHGVQEAVAHIEGKPSQETASVWSNEPGIVAQTGDQSYLTQENPMEFTSESPSEFSPDYSSEFTSEFTSEFPSEFPPEYPSEYPSEFPSGVQSVQEGVPSQFPEEMPTKFPQELPLEVPPEGLPDSLSGVLPNSILEVLPDFMPGVQQGFMQGVQPDFMQGVQTDFIHGVAADTQPAYSPSEVAEEDPYVTTHRPHTPPTCAMPHFNKTNQCAQLCNNYDVCLPLWVDPYNAYQLHCFDADEEEAKRASALCVLCLLVNGVPQKVADLVPTETTTSDVCCDCLDPCGCVCNYEEMCMPDGLDPEGRFQPKCSDVGNEGYPSSWCVSCLKTHGLPGYAETGLPSDGANPDYFSDQTEAIIEFEPTTMEYEPITTEFAPTTVELAPWTTELVSMTSRKPKKTTTTARPKKTTTRRPNAHKKITPKKDLTTKPTPTTDIEGAQYFNVTDSCASLCNDFHNICLPHWLDPLDAFRPHCHSKKGSRVPSDHCINCLMVIGVPQGKGLSADSHHGPAFCCDCVDPCGCVCDYEEMCVPDELDPSGRFQPRCSEVDNRGYPSASCVYCLKTRGLPDEGEASMEETTDFVTVAIESPMEHGEFTTQESMATIAVWGEQDIFGQTTSPIWGMGEVGAGGVSSSVDGASKRPKKPTTKPKKVATKRPTSTTEPTFGVDVTLLPGLGNIFGPEYQGMSTAFGTSSVNEVAIKKPKKTITKKTTSTTQPTVNIPSLPDMIQSILGTEDERISATVVPTTTKKVPAKKPKRPTTKITTTTTAPTLDMDIMPDIAQIILGMADEPISSTVGPATKKHTTRKPRKPTTKTTSTAAPTLDMDILPDIVQIIMGAEGGGTSSAVGTATIKNTTKKPRRTTTKRTPMPTAPTIGLDIYPDINQPGFGNGYGDVSASIDTVTRVPKPKKPGKVTPKRTTRKPSTSADIDGLQNSFTPVTPPMWGAETAATVAHTTRKPMRTTTRRPTRRPATTSATIALPDLSGSMFGSADITASEIANNNARKPSTERTTRRPATATATIDLPDLSGSMFGSGEITASEVANSNAQKSPTEITTRKPKGASSKTTSGGDSTLDGFKWSVWGSANGQLTTEMFSKPLSDPCRQTCNNYVDICLPDWLDPFNVFSPHCDGISTVGPNEMNCILCLRNHGLTSSTARPTLPTVKKEPSPPSYDVEPSYNQQRFDPCRSICNNYIDVCLPDWLDPFNIFSPHCDGTSYIRPFQITCILCLKTHGLTSSTARPTEPSYMKSPSTPAYIYENEPYENVNPEWTTTIEVPPEEVISLAPTEDFVEECPEICTCTRTQTTTTEVAISYCPLMYDEDYECDLNDPSAQRTTTDESHCSCEKDERCSTLARL